MTQIENTPNKPMDSMSVKPELSSLTATNKKALDSSQLLDIIATNLFTILKIGVFTLLLLALIFVFIKIYTQQGVVILPFEISKNENISSNAIADQLTAELMRIKNIHSIKYDEIILKTNRTDYRTKFSSEQSLGNREMVVPKAETVKFSMADIGSIGIGSNSLSLGNIIVAFNNMCPGSKPVTTIRGSLQRYGSTIVLVALQEGSNVKSWVVRQQIEKNNEDQLLEMIKNLAFMIAHEPPQSNVSAKTWEGLKYYTDALDAYQQYKLSGNLEYLYLAGNYSLKAISLEKKYEKPFDLLSSLELHMLSIGRQNDATEYCKKNLELDPKYAPAWINKGIVLSNQDKYDEAIKAYDEAIRLDPEDATAWNNKGSALGNLDKYDEAIKAYDEAIRLDPEDDSVWNNKGAALHNQDQYDEAIKAYDEAIRLDPKHGSAWNNKGKALGDLRRYDEAIKAYDEAIRLDPKHAGASNNKGVALFNQGKYDESIEAFDEALKLDPDLAEAWYNKGKALEVLGKTAEADAALEKAKELGYEG